MKVTRRGKTLHITLTRAELREHIAKSKPCPKCGSKFVEQEEDGSFTCGGCGRDERLGR